MSEETAARGQRSRFFRYSVRTLLVVVTLVAVTFAYRASQVSRQRRAVQSVAHAGAFVLYHDEGWWPFRGYGAVPPDDTVAGWFREFFALRHPGEVHLGGADVTDQTLEAFVLPLKTLGAISLTETSVTQEGLGQLAGLPKLRMVALHSDARHDEITGQLTEPTMIDFHEVPLQDGVDYLVDLHAMPIEIDTERIPEGVLIGHVGLTGTFQDKPLGSSLTELLAPADLGWIVTGGHLLITTRAVSEQREKEVAKVRAALPQVKTLIID